jgi:hypothetical protein
MKKITIGSKPTTNTTPATPDEWVILKWTPPEPIPAEPIGVASIGEATHRNGSIASGEKG